MQRRSNRDGIAYKWSNSLWGKDAKQLAPYNIQAAIIVLQARKQEIGK